MRRIGANPENIVPFNSAGIYSGLICFESELSTALVVAALIRFDGVFSTAFSVTLTVRLPGRICSICTGRDGPGQIMSQKPTPVLCLFPGILVFHLGPNQTILLVPLPSQNPCLIAPPILDMTTPSSKGLLIGFWRRLAFYKVASGQFQTVLSVR